MMTSIPSFSDDPSKIDYVNPAYRRMSKKWQLIHDLESTESMREAGRRWLPQEQGEEDFSYKVRLERSILFEAYKETVSNIASRPFVEPVIVNNLPQELQGFEIDIDGEGSGLTSFASEIFRNAIDYGISHIFADFPILTEDIVTLGDEVGRQCVLVSVPPTNLLGWRKINKRLVSVRIYNVECLDDGIYGDKEVEVIRLYDVVDPNNGFVETWVRGIGEQDFERVSKTEFTLGYIPLCTLYTNKKGYLEGYPPLYGLAWLNMSHWQSMSDFRNTLKFAMIGILAAFGFRTEEIDKIIISTSKVVKSTNENASLKYVEYEGKALDAGAKTISDLEDKMERFGLQPFFITRAGRETATAKSIDEARSISDIQQWTHRMEKCLTQAFMIAADWKGVELPEDFLLSIFNDFSQPMKTSEDLDIIDRGRARRDISHSTYIRELKRRGTLSETVVPDVEAENIQTEPEFGQIEKREEELKFV